MQGDPSPKGTESKGCFWVRGRIRLALRLGLGLWVRIVVMVKMKVRGYGYGWVRLSDMIRVGGYD